MLERWPATETRHSAPDHSGHCTGQPLTATQISTALLRGSDVPAGFQQGSAAQTSALSSLCGNPALFSLVPPSSQVDEVFLGPADSNLSERMDAFRNNRVAQAFVVELRAQATCSSVSAETVTPIGEEVNAWRVIGSLSADEVLWFEQGSPVVQLSARGLAADEVLVPGAEQALVRLKQALA